MLYIRAPLANPTFDSRYSEYPFAESSCANSSIPGTDPVSSYQRTSRATAGRSLSGTRAEANVIRLFSSISPRSWHRRSWGPKMGHRTISVRLRQDIHSKRFPAQNGREPHPYQIRYYESSILPRGKEIVNLMFNSKNCNPWNWAIDDSPVL